MQSKSRLRQLQEWSANRNWRINYIFYPEDKGIFVTKIKNPMGWISIAGILLFLTSFAYFMIKQDRNENIELTIAAFVLGFVMAALGSIFHETIRKKGWPTIRAQCLDHETKFGRTPDNHKIWTMRLLCRFRIDEQEIECTPEVFWPKRKGEEWKRSYLAEDSEGALFCSLLVNPENPHETYLLARKEPNQSR